MDNFNDMFEDDLEILEIVEHGFPRQIYERTNYIQTLDDAAFFRRFRLTKNTVIEILRLVEERLEFPYDRNRAVPPIDQLLITLRFYAAGNHLLAVADFTGIHVSTASRIIKRVSEAIADLCLQFINMPTTEEEIMKEQREFYNIAHFPRVLGAIDGTHIRISSPGGEDAEVFRNRKGYFSINVQAVSNSDMKFANIVARWPGSVHDVTMLNNSLLQQKFENGDFANSLLLGDGGYNTRAYLLTPLVNVTTRAQQLYNDSHIKTRNIVERLFGVWKRRFPVMAYGCRLKIDTVLSVITATAVLHNIARDMKEIEPPEVEEIAEHELDILIANGQIPAIPIREAGGIGMAVRNSFINDYFSNL